jgi:hypothetical protein
VCVSSERACVRAFARKCVCLRVHRMCVGVCDWVCIGKCTQRVVARVRTNSAVRAQISLSLSKRAGFSV